jgi:hypothetical protein
MSSLYLNEDGSPIQLKNLLNDFVGEADEEKCLITNLPLTDNFVKLECGHKFNYIPIYTEICTSKKDAIGKSSKTIQCPYCRKIQNTLLPYYNLPGVEKVKNVNHKGSLSVKKNASLSPDHGVMVFVVGCCESNKVPACETTTVTWCSNKFLCQAHYTEQLVKPKASPVLISDLANQVVEKLKNTIDNSKEKVFKEKVVKEKVVKEKVVKEPKEKLVKEKVVKEPKEKVVKEPKEKVVKEPKEKVVKEKVVKEPKEKVVKEKVVKEKVVKESKEKVVKESKEKVVKEPKEKVVKEPKEKVVKEKVVKEPKETCCGILKSGKNIGSQCTCPIFDISTKTCKKHCPK